MTSSLVRNVERSYEKPFAVLFISAACSMILDDITKALTPPFSGKENWRGAVPVSAKPVGLQEYRFLLSFFF